MRTSWLEMELFSFKVRYKLPCNIAGLIVNGLPSELTPSGSGLSTCQLALLKTRFPAFPTWPNRHQDKNTETYNLEKSHCVWLWALQSHLKAFDSYYFSDNEVIHIF